MAEKLQFYAPPPKRSTKEQISTFLWNSETNEFLGRTFSSWAKILLFYIIFYIVLSAYWGGLWIVFDSIAIRNDKPRYMLKESLIGSNPGLGYRPMPSEEFIDSSLIWFKTTDESFLNWTTQLKSFLDPYKKSRKEDKDVLNCSYNDPPGAGKVCRVPVESMAPCNDNFFMYDKGNPCIFLKLNKIFNWIPEVYNDTRYLPSTMPKSLKSKIELIERNNRKELNTVWVSCEGENAADKEHIGAINYLPSPGFPSYYFPFNNANGYLSPLVAVWFENPVRGVLINVECKAWAKNIIYDRHDRRGSVHFEIMVDN